jgi:[citrate (pro-3S)-lyase] ligase
VEQAARQCDWLHLFVVKEDASRFTYQDRYTLIEKGIAGIDKVTLHPGSAYLISRATFPGYFLKEQGWWTTATARSICSCSANI